ncbi:G2/mitotic-specific cyclin-B3 [Toxocara canis]|uniref:G2/mitotic-specific cyclin-B3 n=1 Tax=Toxocara canis TaxID=6265 RepID=A0A0B2UXF1_TOXCA|nr:G2/mitotic-specific cyclin-B3 [Toxocara canis]
MTINQKRASVERKLAGTMMLRSRNGNTAAPAQDSNDISVPVKRQAVNTNDDVRDQPKRKRVALSDLSNAVSNNLLIDSSKKSADKEQQQKRRGAAKTLEVKVDETQSPSEEQSHMSNKKRFSKLREPLSDVNVSDESVVLIEDNVAEEMEVECPEYDFDAECAGDPYAVSMYAFDIFKYYVSREPKFRVGDYLKVQPQLTKEMRAVLADWMVEVQECFELNHETLYMAMKLTDLYLDRVPNVGRDDLQLIASTALFVAAKFDERSPPLIDDFMFICEDSFTREALIRMEHKMLKVIRFDLGCPLSYRFLRRYARVCKTDMGTLTLARYILETSLMFYEFVPVSDSLMGAACFLMAIRMKKLGDWNPVLVKYTGYRLGEVEPLMWRLNHMMVMRPKVYDRLVTAYNKYRHEVFFRSAAVPLLDDVFPTSEPVGPPPHLGFSSF